MLKKNSITFSRHLKVFNTEKGKHHCLKVFNIEKGLHHFLMTLKVFQNNCSVECWWTAASEGHIFIYELDLLWVPNFIALWIYFFFGTKSSWNEGIYTCFNLECVLLDRNFDFLGDYFSLPNGYYWLLLVTGGYCSLLLVPTFSMNEKRLQHRCFLVKLKKFLRTSIFKNICEQLLLQDITEETVFFLQN